MTDRRIRRTKKNVYTALASLLFEKDIRNITVKELCEKADINKSTFYLHFLDIYDCKEKWQSEIYEEILSSVHDLSLEEIVNSPTAYIDSIVTYFNENIEFYRKLMRSALAAEFSYNLKDKLRQRIIASNALETERNRREISMVAFVMGGLIDACIINLTAFDADDIGEALQFVGESIIDLLKERKLA